MGGPGSGDWVRWNSKTTADDLKKIDIRYMKRQGMLYEGYVGVLSWWQGDVSTGNVYVYVKQGFMTIKYRTRFNKGPWHDIQQDIKFDSTACNLGGSRQWFLCPDCGKRVAILYAGGIKFLCRHCHDLSYQSKNEDQADRMRRKARKIRNRLGASGDLFQPVLFKPKGMHQKTFDRLRQAEYEANQTVLWSMAKDMGLI